MQNNQINNEIGALLEIIEEQHKHILSHTNGVPQIELDLILGNISKLYEQFLFLKKKNKYDGPDRSPVLMPMPDAGVKPQVSVEPRSVIIEPAQPLVTYVKEKSPLVSFVVRPHFVAEASLVESVEPTTERNKAITETTIQQSHVVKESINPEVESLHPEILGKRNDVMDLPKTGISGVEDEFSPESVKKPALEPVKQKHKEPAPAMKQTILQNMGLFDSIATVADKYEGQPSLHDKISKNQTDSSLGKKLQNKSIEDLKKSIGINEKFSFINELFEGDLNNYNKAIDTLNQFEVINDARQYIREHLYPKYNWDMEGKSFKNLQELLERRFKK